MRKVLPSVSSLRAFEAAARHLSFTRAAIELSITQGAISQRIAKLEAVLGAKLFAREGNALYLSPLGEAFLPSARDTIIRLARATDEAVERHHGTTLSIDCIATYGMKMLSPRLHDFRARNPDLSVRLRSFTPGESPLSEPDVPQPAAAPTHEPDVCIQFGTGSWPGTTSHKLGDEYVFPVCSAAAMRRSGDLKQPEDLRHHTVILSASPITGYDYWPLWLEQVGSGGLSFREEIFCNPYYVALQAAVDGLGAIMARSSLVTAELASGLLIAPFRERLHSPLSYHLVVPRERANMEKVERFVAWAMTALDPQSNPGLTRQQSRGGHRTGRSVC